MATERRLPGGLRRALLVCGLLGPLCATSLARAQPSGQDVATAQALFEEGKRLMDERKFAEACPKLVESQRLDPGGGTLLAIALCHEGEGKTATAWADFTLALSEARKDHRADREAAAQEHVDALAARLTKVRVVVMDPAPDIAVSRDGGPVGSAQWSTPIPLDPGSHTFEASAPGRRPWSQVVEIRGEGQTVDVVVPALAVADAPPPPPPPTPSPAPRPEPGGDEGDEGASQRTWAFIAGGAGLLVTGVGVAFGISASSKWSDAEKACPNNRCPDESAKKLGEDAGRAADISTVLIGIGAAGLVTGGVLYFTAPKASARGVRVVPSIGRDGGGVWLRGEL